MFYEDWKDIYTKGGVFVCGSRICLTQLVCVNNLFSLQGGILVQVGNIQQMVLRTNKMKYIKEKKKEKQKQGKVVVAYISL